MANKEHNAFLISAPYGIGNKRGLGYLSIEEINDLLQTIKDCKVPSDSCISQIYTELKQTTFNSCLFKKTSEHHRLNIMITTARKCGIRTRDLCAGCIATGKCTDEFAREIIGKKLFADKYQGK